MQLAKLKHHSACISLFISFTFFVLSSQPLLAQSDIGILAGTVFDGTTGKKLPGVGIKVGNRKMITVLGDGSYTSKLEEGNYSVLFSLKGFQQKQLSNIVVMKGEITQLNIVLFPLSVNGIPKETLFLPDSLSALDTLVTSTFFGELTNQQLHPVLRKNGEHDFLAGNNVQPGIHRDLSSSLKRLHFVNVFDLQTNNQLQTTTIGGMSSRYSQVLFNGLPFESFNPLGKVFPFQSIPVESLETVSVHTSPDAALPADFAGGTINIQTKDLPERNFFYVLGGAGVMDDFQQKTLLTDQKTTTQWLGFPGKVRDLPASFPTTRDRTLLNQLNTQEQNALVRQMRNNLAPQKQAQALPNVRLMLGFGKSWQIKGDQRFGIIAFIQQRKEQQVDFSEVQVSPDVTNNPYPFSNGSLPLVRSFSADSTFSYSSFTSAVVNASYVTAKSKITFKNLIVRQFNSHTTKRSQVLKPDEDTLSQVGLHYLTEQRFSINTQLAGEHMLGDKTGFQMDWKAGYSFYKHEEPDERTFLLSQNPAAGSEYRFATQSTASVANEQLNFLNSGRSWKSFTDHGVNASVNLSMPFNFLNYAQQIKGGLFFQTNYRESYSDLFLISQNNADYFSLDALMAADRYYPDGLTVMNYNTKLNTDGLFYSIANSRQPNLGNYVGSSNTGAAFVQVDSRLAKSIRLNVGLRAESTNQSVSNIQYQYTESFERPQLYSINLNSRVNKFNLLPHLKVLYSPFRIIQLHGSFSKTVNRPQLRELANYRSHHPGSFMVQQGNPILETATIDNYSAGLDIAVSSGSGISINGFYKVIDRPIENVISVYSSGYMLSTPRNTPPAYIRGVQASAKLNLYSVFKTAFASYVSLFASSTLLRSNVGAGPVKGSSDVAKHSLSGTPDYTINAGFVIHHPKWPNVSVIYQETSDHLLAVGSGSKIELQNGNNISAVPNYRVAKRDQLDVQISQKIFSSSFQVIVGINNLLKTPLVHYQDLNGNGMYDTPLKLLRQNNGAYYRGGTDNTIVNMKTHRQYYITISYLLK